MTKSNTGNTIDLKMVYGNRHREVPNPKASKRTAGAMNKHEWVMFVKFEDKNIKASTLIEKIRFGLHESFGKDHRDIKPSPDGKFEMKYTGWGIFDIPITIYWKHGTGMNPRESNYEHCLCFDGAGEWKTTTISLPKTNAQNLGIKIPAATQPQKKQAAPVAKTKTTAKEISSKEEAK